jgi:hypothetical protein
LGGEGGVRGAYRVSPSLPDSRISSRRIAQRMQTLAPAAQMIKDRSTRKRLKL